MNNAIVSSTNYQQRAAEVNQVLELVQPAMQADGGGCRLVDITEDNIVKIQFEGTCLFCPSQKLTLNMGIARTLREHLPWIKDVLKA